MAERRIRIIVFLLFVCCLFVPCRTMAASTTDAAEPILIDKECSLSLSFSCDDTAFPGINVSLYKVAEVSSDFQYTPTSSFVPAGLILNGIKSSGEWDVIRSTLSAYIVAESINAYTTAVTDQSGQVCFENLPTGLYFVASVNAMSNNDKCFFESALIALPGIGADGTWEYQVEVTPKYEIIPPAEEEISLKVVKLWKGDEGKKNRPKSIEVEIFCDGKSYKTVTLSDKNNWMYSWTTDDNGYDWNVIERNVPSGYTMTVEERGFSFVLTNTFTEVPPDTPADPPQTGDTVNIMFYVVIMYISGALFIVAGFTGKRKRA